MNLKVDTNTRDLGNCKLSYEGGKYYIQVGADAGTKKPLGSGELSSILINLNSYWNSAGKYYDVTQVTDDYGDLTINNFVCGTPRCTASGGQGINNSTTKGANFSYDAANGYLYKQEFGGGDGGLYMSLNFTVFVILAF